MIKRIIILLLILSVSALAAQDFQKESDALKKENETLKTQMEKLSRMVDQLEGKNIVNREDVSETEYYSLLRETLPDIFLSEEDYYKNVQLRVKKVKTYGEAIKILETYIAYFPEGKYRSIVKNQVELRKIKIKKMSEKKDFIELQKTINKTKSIQDSINLCRSFIKKYPAGDHSIDVRIILGDLLKKELRGK